MNKHGTSELVSPRRTPEQGRRLAGVCLFALTLLLSAGEIFHSGLHPDAGEPNHDCALVHWAHGEIGFAQINPTVTPAEATVRLENLSAVPLPRSSAPVFPRHARGPPQV